MQTLNWTDFQPWINPLVWNVCLPRPRGIKPKIIAWVISQNRVLPSERMKLWSPQIIQTWQLHSSRWNSSCSAFFEEGGFIHAYSSLFALFTSFINVSFRKIQTAKFQNLVNQSYRPLAPSRGIRDKKYVKKSVRSRNVKLPRPDSRKGTFHSGLWSSKLNGNKSFD